MGVSSLADVYTSNIVVGSTTPALFLDDSDVSNLRHSIIGGGNAGLEISADINNATTGYIRFNVGGSVLAQLNEGGNFGIGTTSPEHQLQVVGTGQTTLSIKAGTNKQANIEFENDGTGYSICLLYTSPSPRDRG